MADVWDAGELFGGTSEPQSPSQPISNNFLGFNPIFREIYPNNPDESFYDLPSPLKPVVLLQTRATSDMTWENMDLDYHNGKQIWEDINVIPFNNLVSFNVKNVGSNHLTASLVLWDKHFKDIELKLYKAMMLGKIQTEKDIKKNNATTQNNAALRQDDIMALSPVSLAHIRVRWGMVNDKHSKNNDYCNFNDINDSKFDLSKNGNFHLRSESKTCYMSPWRYFKIVKVEQVIDNEGGATFNIELSEMHYNNIESIYVYKANSQHLSGPLYFKGDSKFMRSSSGRISLLGECKYLLQKVFENPKLPDNKKATIEFRFNKTFSGDSGTFMALLNDPDFKKVAMADLANAKEKDLTELPFIINKKGHDITFTNHKINFKYKTKEVEMNARATRAANDTTKWTSVKDILDSIMQIISPMFLDFANGKKYYFETPQLKKLPTARVHKFDYTYRIIEEVQDGKKKLIFEFGYFFEDKFLSHKLIESYKRGARITDEYLKPVIRTYNHLHNSYTLVESFEVDPTNIYLALEGGIKAIVDKNGQFALYGGQGSIQEQIAQTGNFNGITFSSEQRFNDYWDSWERDGFVLVPKLVRNDDNNLPSATTLASEALCRMPINAKLTILGDPFYLIDRKCFPNGFFIRIIIYREDGSMSYLSGDYMLKGGIEHEINDNGYMTKMELFKSNSSW